MNKKIIIGICVVAVCLIIGLTQMKGGRDSGSTIPEVKKITDHETQKNDQAGDIVPTAEQTERAEQAELKALNLDAFIMICAKDTAENLQKGLDEESFEVDGISQLLGITPLMAAISDKDTQRSLAKARMLIKAGASPSLMAIDDEKQTPLHLAAQKGNSVDLLDFLIASGADVNAQDAAGLTPLMIAAMTADILSPQDQIHTLTSLISAEADLNKSNNKGVAALSLAAVNASPKVLQLLIENGAEVNAADHQGRTALMTAAWGNSPEALETLLKNRADPTIKDKDGLGVLDHAKLHNNPAAEKINGLLKAPGQ